MHTTLSDVYALNMLSFGVLSLLLLCVLGILLRVLYRLRRLELKNSVATEEMIADAPIIAKPKNKSEASEFEKFLEEDGKRRLLSKREQAAAFRDWRKQRGVTWGKDTP